MFVWKNTLLTLKHWFNVHLTPQTWMKILLDMITQLSFYTKCNTSYFSPELSPSGESSATRFPNNLWSRIKTSKHLNEASFEWDNSGETEEVYFICVFSTSFGVPKYTDWRESLKRLRFAKKITLLCKGEDSHWTTEFGSQNLEVVKSLMLWFSFSCLWHEYKRVSGASLAGMSGFLTATGAEMMQIIAEKKETQIHIICHASM